MNNEFKKIIFITSFHPLISRNIIATLILQKLTESDFFVVLLVPDFKKAYFQKMYGKDGVITIEGVDCGASVRTLRVGIMKRLAEALPNTKRAALGRARTLSGGKKSKLYYYFFYFPAGILGKFIFFHRLARLIDYVIMPRGRFYDVLKKYTPDLVFATDIQNEHDVSLMQDARRHGIKTLGMVRSWDNLTTRAIRFVPDEIIVHNENIKKEAERYHGINGSLIHITGIPHYDRYMKGPTKKREEFLRGLGLDPSKKLLVYFPLCDYRLLDNSVDTYVLEILSVLGHNVIVRFPPAETVSLRDFKKPPQMVFDRPGNVFNENVGNRDLTPEDDERFLNMLSCADCVIAGPSTAIIDASVFDTPVVLIDFYPKAIPDDEKIYEYGAEHILSVLCLGGVIRAKSREEFLQAIDTYLKNPALHREGRKRIAEEQCWKLDGNSSERMTEILLWALEI